MNKKEEDFSDAEIEKLLEFAKEQEPIIVEALRQRDQVLCEEDFVLAPFITPLGDKLKQDIEISSFQLRENLFEQIGSTKHGAFPHEVYCDQPRARKCGTYEILPESSSYSAYILFL